MEGETIVLFQKKLLNQQQQGTKNRLHLQGPPQTYDAKSYDGLMHTMENRFHTLPNFSISFLLLDSRVCKAIYETVVRY